MTYCDNKNEMLPIVDNCGNVLGKMTREKAHNGSKILHPVVHLHVFNSQGELFLQKRPVWKDIQPSKWDTACGGHIDYGESIEQALRREVQEELNITDYIPQLLKSYIFESDREKELIHVYTTIYDKDITPNCTELDSGKFWKMSEIDKNIGKSVFTPNFENEYISFVKNMMK